MSSDNSKLGYRQQKEEERLVTSEYLKSSFIDFVAYFFKKRTGDTFIINWHHLWMTKVCELVYTGDLQNVILNLSPGGTKCCCADTPIAHINGETPIQNIVVGDIIYSYSKGKLVEREVIATETYKKLCIEIFTRAGNSLKISYDHPVLTQDGWKQAQFLKSADYMISVMGDREFGIDLTRSGDTLSPMADFVYERVDYYNVIGNREVYHLEIGATDYDDKNFIANGFVVHNTEIISIGFPAWCYAKNPHCRFLEASFSDDRVTKNSIGVKNIIESEEFQYLFGDYKFKKDMKAKATWAIETNLSGEKAVGEFNARSMGGEITGGRAGYMIDGLPIFSGALIIDDPLKPDDAYSPSKRDTNNRIFSNTLISRLAESTTPIMIVMQRLHENDFTNHVLTQHKNFNWKVISIPAVIDLDYVEQLEDIVIGYDYELQKNITLKAIANKQLKDSFKESDNVSYWAKSNTLDNLVHMAQNDQYTFTSQYMQSPTPMGGSLFKDSWWVFEETIPRIFDYVRIVGDTAQKTGQHNDYSVLLTYGMKDNVMYIINVLRGKWEAPDLLTNSKAYYNAAKERFGHTLQSMYIEDKVSGTGLLQTLKVETRIPIVAVQREKDKVSRAVAATTHIQAGRVVLPKTADWMPIFIGELSRFSPAMTHDHDDIVDCLVTAVEIEFITNYTVETCASPIY